MAKNCTYTFNGKTYTDEDFMQFLHETNLDLPEVRQQLRVQTTLNNEAKTKIDSLEKEYKDKLNGNPIVKKVVDILNQSGAQNVNFNEELANKLGISNIQLYDAVNTLRNVNLEYKSKKEEILNPGSTTKEKSIKERVADTLTNTSINFTPKDKDIVINSTNDKGEPTSVKSTKRVTDFEIRDHKASVSNGTIEDDIAHLKTLNNNNNQSIERTLLALKNSGINTINTEELSTEDKQHIQELVDKELLINPSNYTSDSSKLLNENSNIDIHHDNFNLVDNNGKRISKTFDTYQEAKNALNEYNANLQKDIPTQYNIASLNKLNSGIQALEATEEIIQSTDKRLEPVVNGDVNHMAVISKALSQGQYEQLYREGKVTQEQLKEIFSSIYGEDTADYFSKAVVWKSNPENVTRLNTINAWSDINNPDQAFLMKQIINNGNLQAAIENDFLPIGDMISISNSFDLPSYIQDIVTERAKQSQSKQLIDNEIADKQIASETQLTKEDIPEVLKEEPKEEKVQVEEPEEIEEPENTPVQIAQNYPDNKETIDLNSEVTFKGKNYIVSSIDEDGMLKLYSIDGKQKEYAFPQQVTKVPTFEPVNVDHIIRVAEKIKEVFPTLNFQIVDTNEEWLGKIKDGIVLLNKRKANIDTPIHEFLHPFVLALRNENQTLYRSLLSDLQQDGQNFIEEVKSNKNYDNLNPAEKLDESLVRWLSHNIKDTFNEDGSINEDKLEEKRKSIIDFVYDWFKKLFDLIVGSSRNVKNANDFAERLNNKAPGFKIVSDRINSGLKSELVELANEKIIVVNKDKYGRYSTPESIFSDIKDQISQIEYDKLINKATSAIKASGRKGKEVKDFKSIEFSPDTNKIKFYSEGSTEIGRKVDLSELTVSNLMSDAHFNRTMAEDFINKYNDWTLDKNGSSVFKYDIDQNLIDSFDYTSAKDKISVADLPGNLTTEQLSALIVAQNKIQFDLSSQQDAINSMEAYSYDTAVDNDKFKENLRKKAEVLLHTVTQRIAGGFEVGQKEALTIKNMINNLDDAELVMSYIREGFQGLDFANYYFNSLKRELYNPKSNLTQEDVNRLNNDFQKYKTFVNFYDDVVPLLDRYEDYFSKQDIKGFNKIITEKSLNREKIQNTVAELVTKWLYPNYEKSINEIIAKNPKTSVKALTEQEFKNQLRVADKDMSGNEFWLGAMIDSSDPINQTVANVIEESFIRNDFADHDVSNDIGISYAKTVRANNIGDTVKDVEEFYKKNYLRKAQSYEQIGYDTENKKPIDGVVERWAFHEKYLYDIWANERRKFDERLKKPLTPEQEKENDTKRLEWSLANSKIVDGVTIPSDKYLNPSFSALQNNSDFKLLYDQYKTSNAKYGDRQLRYGIVPQQIKEGSFIDKLKETGEGIKNNIKGTKDIFNNKEQTIGDNTRSFGRKVVDKLFGNNRDYSKSFLNLDDSHYRTLQAKYVGLINDQEHVNLLLNETVVGMTRDANTFASLRDVQANFENLKYLMLGNPKMGITARQALKISKNQKVFDKITGRPQQAEQFATRLNQQLMENVNDILYGESEFRSDLGPINLNRLGKEASFYTALTTMAGNITAGISNITLGNIMNIQEAVGGKYWTGKAFRWAWNDYNKNIPNFIKDMSSVVKSKDTQLAIKYDAVQGEFRNEFGQKVTGALARKLLTRSSFFFLNHAGEHQIQVTGMKAMMKSQEVKLKDGTITNLYDAYQDNGKGHVVLRDDAIWNIDNDVAFTKTMHSLSRSMHGNYSAQHKAAIQRRWWGKLAIVYKKYLYENFKARYTGERVSFGRGDVTEGYYNTFFSRLNKDIKEYGFNLSKLANSQWNREGWSDIEKYNVNKTLTDLAFMGMIFGLVAGLSGGDSDKDSKAKAYLLLTLNRAFNDIGMYNIQFPQELYQQYQNPTAAGRSLKNISSFFGQLVSNPTGVYDKNGYMYSAGDSKLGNKFEKLLPVISNIHRSLEPAQQNQFYNILYTNIGNK